MKFKLISLAVGLALGTSAIAAPININTGSPLYIKFDNREQIALGGANTGYANEINWGVMVVSTIDIGAITGTNVIEPTNTRIFSNAQTNNGQITGIFYGIEAAPVDAGSTFPATKGYLDLYWRDLGTYTATALATALPTVRTAQDKASGFTDGDFLARLVFASGVTASATTFINGTVVPSAQGFTGFASSFANVDEIAGGLWADALNTDWFTTSFGTRDFRFRNIYEELALWGDCAGGVCGARSSDPATTVAIPEPGTLALLGISILGLGFSSRRKAS